MRYPARRVLELEAAALAAPPAELWEDSMVEVKAPGGGKGLAGQGRLWLLLALVLLAGGGYAGWLALQPAGLPAGIASGNGRIQAVDIDIDTKYPGRVQDVLVDEGDFVQAGQVVAQMDTYELAAELRQARAEQRRAEIGVQTAQSLVVQRQYEQIAAKAAIAQNQAQLDAAQLRLARSKRLVGGGAVPQQTVDDDEAAFQSAVAGLAAAQAQAAASSAAVSTAQAQVVDAQAAVDAAEAAVQHIQIEIDDATLRAPRDGRVQYRVAQPGEVLGAGGRVLNMVDLTDVYMTFYLPTDQAGRVAVGAPARIVLDAAPQYVVPAQISYVADVAQFTPKTVETADERQALMFRVKARIPDALLRNYIREVKTGLPGVAYVQIDPKTPWPAFLRNTQMP